MPLGRQTNAVDVKPEIKGSDISDFIPIGSGAPWQEIEILGSYLPKSLSPDEIAAALAPVLEQIKAAGNDGQATGIAMKQLKSVGAVVNGKDVGAAIKALRKA